MNIFFGIPEIDCLLGSDFKGGQIIELFGPSQCGKTFLALMACSRMGLSLWLDLDGTFPYVYADRMDLHERIIIVSQPSSIIEATESFLEKCSPDIIVVDPTHVLWLRERIKLYNILTYAAVIHNIPVVLVSSGIDRNIMAKIAAIRIEMAPVKYKANKVTYFMRTIKNVNAPAWQEASFTKENT